MGLRKYIYNLPFTYPAARVVAKWLVWYTTKTFWVGQPGTRCHTRDLDEMTPEEIGQEIQETGQFNRCANCLAWDMIDSIVQLYDLKPPPSRRAPPITDDEEDHVDYPA